VTTRFLSRSVVAELLDVRACITAVEDVFRNHAAGRTVPPGVLGAHVTGGGFHVKTAGILGDRAYFAAKVNANFPANPARLGLPTIQGVIALFDADSGRVLALLDSAELTAVRTAAATAVAAKFLARDDADSVTICGCGAQGAAQLRALAAVRPLRRVLAYDTNTTRAQHFAAELSRELGTEVRATEDIFAAARESSIIVTCTPARQPLLGKEHVRPGTFVAGVGADSEEKNELAPALLAASRVVVDILAQCAAIGDLHHALAAGAMTQADVHAELADVVSGERSGRRSEEEVWVFDSTGTALQDVAAAALVFERACQSGRGVELDLSA